MLKYSTSSDYKNNTKTIFEKENSKYLKFYERIIYGIKTKNTNYSKLFYKNGLGHLLSISGLHLYSIFKFSFIILNLFLFIIFKNTQNRFIVFKYSFVFSMLLCFLYLYKINLTVPRFRSFLMLLLFYLSYKVKIFQNPFNIILFSASIVILFFPKIDASFIYSFTSVFAISLSKKRTILQICILIFIFLIPVNLYYKGEINFISVINNVIFVSFFSFIYFPFLLSHWIFLSFSSTFLSSLVETLTKFLFYFLNKFLLISDFFTIKFSYIDPSKFVYIFISIIFLYYLFIKKTKNIKLISSFIVLLLVPVFFFNCNEHSDLTIKVFELDKKRKSRASGDFILIKTKKYNILLDTGYVRTYKVIKKLSKMGVNTIDLLILSHEHEDHIGGLKNVLKELNVKKVALSTLFRSKIKPKNHSIVCKDTKIIINHDFRIEFLSPDCGNIRLKENSSSVSFILYFKGNRYLFFSDLDRKYKINNILKKIKDTAYKFNKLFIHYPHHCSKEIILNNIAPDFAFCTRSKYLLKSGIDINNFTYPIYRTGEYGDITIKQVNSNVEVSK